jgi:type II secretory pathway component PulK
MRLRNHCQSSHGPRRAGSALILVLWCLLLLGMAVFGVVDMVELSVDHTAHLEQLMKARAQAASGLALGLNPQLLRNDPLLSPKPDSDGQFTVKIQSEGARLNLNYVLLSNHREILVNLFTQWGLKIADADHVADCLYDWVTPGDLKSLNGAKANDYATAGLPQRPTYQPFASLDEVRLVMGMDLLEKARPQWRDSFTLWSGGPLNVNEAPPDLIAAVFGLDPKQVEFVTNVRNGQDGIPGTPDDVPIPSPQALQSDLGLSTATMEVLGPQVSFSDPNRRVESVGQAGGTQFMISVVTRLNSSPIQYLLWSEQ